MGADTLPPGWRMGRVDDVADVIGGSTPPRATTEYFGGDIPWVTPTDVTKLNRRYLSSSADSLTEAGRRAGGLTVLPVGSVLLTSRATIGAMAIAAVPVTTNQGFQSLVPKDKTDPLWLYYAIQERKPELDALASGSTFREFSRNSLRAVRLPIPSPGGQKCIAERLDAIDAAIERTEDVIAATEKVRKGLLQDLLTRGIPGWHSEWKTVPGIGTVPACWEVVKLGEVGDWFSGGTPSKARPEFWQGHIPWVSPKDMKTRELFDAIDHVSEGGAASGSRIVPPGAIYMVVRGMILAHSFPVAITRVTTAFNQDIKALVCGEHMIPDFVLDVLEHRAHELVQLPTPSTHGTMRVITEELHAVVVPRPPIEEQASIAEYVGVLHRRTDGDRQLLTRLRAIKRETASALLSGRVRVPGVAE